MLLSNFVHKIQRHESDCLVACAQMILIHLGVSAPYERLVRILRSHELFRPFGNLRHLETNLGLYVTLGEHRDIAIFERYIQVGLPLIAAVQTFTWAHWFGENTKHAVVVVGIDVDNDQIYVNDPFWPEAPIGLSLAEFQVGWIEEDRRYGVVSLTSLDE